jgi:hypothetical protein
MTTPSSTKLGRPARRPLRVFAFDPSRGRLFGNEMQLDVRYRRLGPGPVDLSGAHDQIAVVDYDGSRGKYYEPADLDDPFVLIPNGLPPSQSDPRFHQQMVYAVASDTIEHFESALGRRIHWRRAERPPKVTRRGWLPEDILTLVLYPHAMCDANAFYSPDAHGILFGYFKAGLADPGHNLPGQTIFTCLSHDIIVHEMTHAIVDGIRKHFLEQTNPDVPAFHEAFADLAALFRHFSHQEVLLDAVKRTGGRLYTPALKGDPLADLASQSWLDDGSADANPLIGLAAQFGEAHGLQRGLRSAIGKPLTLDELRQPMDCHERGSVLVAAVFEAFFKVYLARAAVHFQVYRSAGGTTRDDVPTPLADVLCYEANRTARQFFQLCVRALDYLPPVDVTFGDFLRAVLTAEVDFDPSDSDGICNAWMEAFRRRRLLPDDAAYFSLDSLCWKPFDDSVEVKGLTFGGPLGLSYPERQPTAQALRTFVDSNRDLLGIAKNLDYVLPSFHPLFHVDATGSIRWDLIVEIVQTRPAARDSYPMRGGTTMTISTHGTAGGGGSRDNTFLRYAIAKPIGDEAGQYRADRQTEYLQQMGVRPGGSASGLRLNFARIHGGN